MTDPTADLLERLARELAEAGAWPTEKELADAFVGCPVPLNECADGCACKPDIENYYHRTGTNFLTWSGAKIMFEEILKRIRDARHQSRQHAKETRK